MSEKRDAQREVTRIALSGIAGFGFALTDSGAIYIVEQTLMGAISQSTGHTLPDRYMTM